MLSHLDYCNRLLLWSTKYNLNKLQMIQNMGCRVIFKTGKYTHVTPLFMEVHWLSVPDRITYKIQVLMFKCIHGLALKYLSDLVVSAHNRELRSSTQNKLPVSHYRTSQTIHHLSHLWVPDYGTLYHSRLETFKLQLYLRGTLRPCFSLKPMLTDNRLFLTNCNI